MRKREAEMERRVIIIGADGLRERECVCVCEEREDNKIKYFSFTYLLK